MYSRSDRSCRLSMSWALHWFHLKSLCHLDCGAAVYYQVLTKCPHKWQSFYHSGFSVHSNVKICLTYGITIALAFIFLLERTKNNIIFLVGLKPGKKKKKVQELCMQEKITTLQHCQHYLLGWIKKRITKKKKKPNQINQTKKPKNCVCERK